MKRDLTTSWKYMVKCAHCNVDLTFNWNTVQKSQDMGYNTLCPICKRTFNFKDWRYVSACPGCAEPFEVDMHSITIDNFGHQYICKKCHGLISCSKDRPPHYIDLKNSIVIPFDASSMGNRNK